jgi:phage recombination protein Bet
MSTALATIGPAALDAEWTDERREFIRKHYCGNAPDAKVDAFLGIAQRRRLSPEEKHIYLVSRAGDWTIQTGIDGYRLIADRTGAYAGSDDPEFVYPPDEDHFPSLARVTVWKMVQGQRCPFTASATWDEYFPGDKQGFMWKKMPRTMLAKCAEALALRKAFPAELSGIYTDAEMDQAQPRSRPPEGPTPTAQVIIEGEVVDADTGEIAAALGAGIAPELDVEHERKRCFAAAKNKMDDEQMKTVVKATWGYDSRTELTAAQFAFLADAMTELTIEQVTPFVALMDALIEDDEYQLTPSMIDDWTKEAKGLRLTGKPFALSVAAYNRAKSDTPFS